MISKNSFYSYSNNLYTTGGYLSATDGYLYTTGGYLSATDDYFILLQIQIIGMEIKYFVCIWLICMAYYLI